MIRIHYVCLINLHARRRSTLHASCPAHRTALYVRATPQTDRPAHRPSCAPTILRTDRPADGRPHADRHANTHARPTCAPTEPARRPILAPTRSACPLDRHLRAASPVVPICARGNAVVKRCEAGAECGSAAGERAKQEMAVLRVRRCGGRIRTSRARRVPSRCTLVSLRRSRCSNREGLRLDDQAVRSAVGLAAVARAGRQRVLAAASGRRHPRPHDASGGASTSHETASPAPCDGFAYRLRQLVSRFAKSGKLCSCAADT